MRWRPRGPTRRRIASPAELVLCSRLGPVDSRRASSGRLKRSETDFMFTGIVEEMGAVRSVDVVGDGCRLVVDARMVLGDVRPGASIAVNGCCLTVLEWGEDWFAVDAVPETLDRTTIGDLKVGDPVNLERPLAADGRFGGHVVQGHVDTITELVEIADQSDGSRRLTFRLPADLIGRVVEKGSVTLDGTSLTVASVASNSGSFDVALIPHTLESTTFGGRALGDRINVEVDVIARYIAGLLAAELARWKSSTGEGATSVDDLYADKCDGSF